MLLRGVGKVWSFEISSDVLFGACLFLVVYLGSSIWVFNRYFDEQYNSRIQIEQIRQLHAEMAEKGRTLYQARQHMALLEDYIRDFEAEGNESDTPRGSGSASVENTRSGNPSGPAEKGMAKSVEPSVDIEDLSIDREGRKLTISFKLVRVRQDEKPASGYVHILAIDAQSDPSKIRAYPEELLKDGLPSHYSQGQLFYIKRFKTIRGEFLLSENDHPTLIRVFVYSRSGTMILQKEFEISS